jgi:hypothetical protein
MHLIYLSSVLLLTRPNRAKNNGGTMPKIMIMLLATFIALGLLAAQPLTADPGKQAAASQNAPKEDRVSGTIVRFNKDKSSMIVKENRSNIELTVFYSEATKWTKGNDPTDMKEFKDGSRVICLGKLNEKRELAATRIDLQTK